MELQKVLYTVVKRNHINNTSSKSAIQYYCRVIGHINKEELNAE